MEQRLALTYSHIYIYIYIPTYICVCVCSVFRFFSLVGYYKISSSLCRTVGPCWLSIIHMLMCRIFYK